MAKRARGSAFVRGNVVHIKYNHPVKGPVQAPTPFRIDELGEDEAKRQARATLDQIWKDIDAGIDVVQGPLTFGEWAVRCARERDQGHVELGVMRKHCKYLWGMPLADIRPRHLQEWIKGMKHGAPASIHKRWSNVRVYLRAAVVAEHIAHVPIMPDNVLPLRVDADPEWRDKAIFTVDECEALISDERIEFARRVLYALKFLTGMRHGECVGLRWGSIDWTAQPLPKIVAARQYIDRGTKTLATKIVPMHPALNVILKAWRAHVTERDGRVPADDAFIVTTWNGTPEHPSHANPALQTDLATLGFRPRDGHDFRATFVSEMIRVCAKAGISEWVIKSVTHPKATVSNRDAFERYKRGIRYEESCAALLCFKVRTMHAVAAELGDISATVASASAEHTVIAHEITTPSDSFLQTEIGTVSGNKRKQAASTGSLRVVRSETSGNERHDAEPHCSDVAATVSDRDATIDALLSHAVALLEEARKLRR